MKRDAEFVERCREMYLRQGMPMATIARRLGCDAGTVRLALREGPVDQIQYARTRIPGARAAHKARKSKRSKSE